MGNMSQILAFSLCTQLVALPSMILGAAVVVDSLRHCYKLWMDIQNPTEKQIGEFGDQVPKEDLAPTDLLHTNTCRVLLISYYLALVGGLTQFAMSYLLFLEKGKFGGNRAWKTWVLCHLFVMCTLAAGFLGVFTLETPSATRLKVFLGITGLDFILHIYFLWFVFMFARTRSRETWIDMHPI